MLEVRGVSKAFGSTQALANVNFKATPGQVLAIVGENGSGKSTLMRVLSGELTPDTGFGLLNDKPLQKGDVFLIHQELALCPHLTVAENVFLGQLGAFTYSPLKFEMKAKAILEGIGYPFIDPAVAVGTLPISLRQVVEIARSLAQDSPVVLFDEPTSSLTKEDATKLFALIKKLRDQGKIILFISHFLDEVRIVADQVVILRDGQLVAESPMTDLNDTQIITHMVGREVSDLFPRSVRTVGQVMLSVAGLDGKKHKPTNAKLELRQGEVIGIAGLNGAGRTELLRAVMALDPVLKGEVTVQAVRPRNVAEAWNRGMGFVSEDRKAEGLALDLSIGENLTMARRPGFLAHPERVAERATTWSKKLSVKCRDVGQRIGDLSGGNQQKVAIARLLDCDCQVLLLDEPTRGIDVGSKAEIYRLIDELACQGKAILMVSSYLPELLGICDRIAVMNRGNLSEFQPASEATQDSLMELCVQ